MANCVYSILQVGMTKEPGSLTKTGDENVADPDYIPPRINSKAHYKCRGDLGNLVA